MDMVLKCTKHTRLIRYETKSKQANLTTYTRPKKEMTEAIPFGVVLKINGLFGFQKDWIYLRFGGFYLSLVLGLNRSVWKKEIFVMLVFCMVGLDWDWFFFFFFCFVNYVFVFHENFDFLRKWERAIGHATGEKVNEI